MRIANAAAFATLVAASTLTLAQNPAPVPVSRPEQTAPAPPILTPGQAPAAGAVRGRGGAGGGANAAAGMGRPNDPNSPAQAGRQALYKYLDDIAATDEAARRAEIAKITTREQAEVRQQEVRAKLVDLVGGGFERTPLNAKVLGSTQMDGFRIEKVLYESQPKFYVTALLYLPDATTGKLPAIVMAPGHAASGKAGDYALATTFVRNGFAVLSYDPIGQGERLQYPDPATIGKGLAAGSLATRPTGEHGEAGLQPTLIGDAVARYFTWDGIRAVDYLISRPEIDPERIGAEGCSGGGAMTALLGAADPRVHATATACYLTTMDTLLASIGAQDAEQSIPGFIAGGFDFADWVELAAPRPYAMVGTVGDMFPWKGFLETAQEARRFYALFDKSAEGTGSCQLSVASCQEKLTTPTGPTLNPDTANAIPATSPFQVIAGIGGHGNLRPITAQIVGFFLVNLAGKSADAYVAPPVAAAASTNAGVPPLASGSVGMTAGAAVAAPAGALQVTPTGQVATSYPGSATVFSLNLERAKQKLPRLPVQTLLQVQTDVRLVTKAEAVPGTTASGTQTSSVASAPDSDRRIDEVFPAPGESTRTEVDLATDPGIGLHGILYAPKSSGKYPAVLMLREDVSLPLTGRREADRERFQTEEAKSRVLFAFTPRPSPAGAEEIKSPILGPFYLTELRAELVDKTLLGMRVDDVIRAVDYLASRPDVDAKNITVVASGHMGLVALHAAVLDPRIKHVTVDHVLESYRSLLAAPMPLDAPQDILPGVLEKYDIPDLVRVLGTRVTATDWLPGTANLGS